MILPGAAYTPSPNFSSRRGAKPEIIVDHYTAGGSAHGSVQWLCNPAARASAHFVIGRKGSVWQLVPLGKKAWHAGRSEATRPSTGETESDVSRFSIGIEYANHGLLEKGDDGRFYYYIGRSRYMYRKDAHPVRGILSFDSGYSASGWWEPYRDAQIEAGVNLCKQLGDLPHIGHHEIAMPIGRKIDPGPFPWEKFGRERPGLRVRWTET